MLGIENPTKRNKEEKTQPSDERTRFCFFIYFHVLCAFGWKIERMELGGREGGMALALPRMSLCCVCFFLLPFYLRERSVCCAIPHNFRLYSPAGFWIWCSRAIFIGRRRLGARQPPMWMKENRSTAVTTMTMETAKSFSFQKYFIRFFSAVIKEYVKAIRGMIRGYAGTYVLRSGLSVETLSLRSFVRFHLIL